MFRRGLARAGDLRLPENGLAGAQRYRGHKLIQTMLWLLRALEPVAHLTERRLRPRFESLAIQ
eukprot:7300841-Lingulodinium_polyedra.AAC.1